MPEKPPHDPRHLTPDQVDATVAHMESNFDDETEAGRRTHRSVNLHYMLRCILPLPRRKKLPPQVSSEELDSVRLYLALEDHASYSKTQERKQVRTKPAEIPSPRARPERSRGRRITSNIGYIGTTLIAAGALAYVGSELWNMRHDVAAAQSAQDRLKKVASDPLALRQLGICAVELDAQRDLTVFQSRPQPSSREQTRLDTLSLANYTARSAKLPCVPLAAGTEQLSVDGGIVNRSDLTQFSKVAWCWMDHTLLPPAVDETTLAVNKISEFFFTPTCDTVDPPRSYLPYTRPQ